MAEKKQDKDKKKKKWVPIVAAKEFNNMEIGETYVEDPNNSIGRTVTINLMALTRDPKKQSNNVTFKITEFKNNVLHTELISISLQTAQLKRTTRKDKTKIEDSFIVDTKDNIKVRFKPILLTKAVTSKSNLSGLRKLTREIVAKHSKNMFYSQFIGDVIFVNIQKAIRNDTKQFYPLASCIIKKVEKV